MSRYEYNLVVVGGGSAGLVASLTAASAGARVALIERARLGGDCLYSGCVPSKTLLASARSAHQVRHAGKFGVDANMTGVDFGRVMDRVRRVISEIEPHDSPERYEHLGVECVLGEARILDGHRIHAAGRDFTARSLVVATGSEPVLPEVPGLDSCCPLTSETVWGLDALPERLLVLGGGPSGCELAQAFARLGSRVTLVESQERLLPNESGKAAALILRALQEDGVRVLSSCRVSQFGGQVAVAFSPDLEAPVEIAFDEVLAAVGRKPRSRGFGLEELGVETHPDGRIAVDRYLRTSVKSVFACGDVSSSHRFTHLAGHQGAYAVINAMIRPIWQLQHDRGPLAWATFTDPEIARVGLTKADCEERGISCEEIVIPLEDLDRARCEGRTEGYFSIVVNRRKGVLVGACIVAPHAGECIAECVLAIAQRIKLKDLLATVHVYPTLSDAIRLGAGRALRQSRGDGIQRWGRRINRLFRSGLLG